MRFKTIGVITVYSFCVFSFSSSQENNSNCSELYGCPTTDNEVFLGDEMRKHKSRKNNTRIEISKEDGVDCGRSDQNKELEKIFDKVNAFTKPSTFIVVDLGNTYSGYIDDENKCIWDKDLTNLNRTNSIANQLCKSDKADLISSDFKFFAVYDCKKNNITFDSFDGLKRFELDPKTNKVKSIHQIILYDEYQNRKNSSKISTQKIINKLGNDLNKSKLQCEDLGYKKGTEKFGECVLKLSE
tara:strand:- start:190 stop:915 length:726 start_codon:yes stop_codon:yes gene_type:complete